jgi:hypothetical protein
MPQVNLIENTLEARAKGVGTKTLVSGSTLALLNNGYSTSTPQSWYDTTNSKTASVFTSPSSSTLVTSSIPELKLGWQFNGSNQWIGITSASLAGMKEATECTLQFAMNPYFESGSGNPGFPFLGNPNYNSPGVGPLPPNSFYTSSFDMISTWAEGVSGTIEQYAQARSRTAARSGSTLVAVEPAFFTENILEVYTFRIVKDNTPGQPDSCSFTKNNITYPYSAPLDQQPENFKFNLFSRLTGSSVPNYPYDRIYFGTNFGDPNATQPTTGIDTWPFSGSLAGLLIYSRSLSDIEVSNNVQFLVNKATNGF